MHFLLFFLSDAERGNMIGRRARAGQKTKKKSKKSKKWQRHAIAHRKEKTYQGSYTASYKT
jgi:hypothetical protein